MSRSLSVCMLACNEQAFLADALLSVQNVADEIVIGIDSRTTDLTESIARRFGARVHHFDWQDDFSAARNIGLSKASKDWVLVIDPDERLTQFGAATVKTVMRQPDTRVEGYCFTQMNRFLDGRPGRQDASTVRLWPNNKQVRYAGAVYEHPAHHGRILKGGVLTGGVAIEHFGGDPTVYAIRSKGERNLRILHKQLERNPRDRMTAYLIVHQLRINGEQAEAAEAAQQALSMHGELPAAALNELALAITASVNA